MTTYNWVFVEDSRSNKTTGKITKKRSYYLCINNRPVKETKDINAALCAERTLLDNGDIINGHTVDELWNEQLAWANGGYANGFKFKVKWMKRKDFNKWRTKKKKDEQLTIKG